MVDLVSIKGAIDGLTAARDIAKSALELRDAAKLQHTVMELNDAILSAQSKALDAQAEQFSLVQKVAELERKLADVDAWEQQQKRYQLVDYGAGTFAYELMAGMENGEAPHRACPSCFEKRQRYVLHFLHRNNRQQDVYQCPSCSTKYSFGAPQDRPTRVRSARRPGSWMG